MVLFFPHFLQFKSEFGNKEFMIWATVCSRSCFCWLYGDSPSLAAKKYNQFDFSIDHLVMSMCRIISCFFGRGCFLWPVNSLGRTLLAYAMLHSLLQGQTCLLLQVSLDFLLLHSSPLWWKAHLLLFVCFSSRRSCRSSQNRSTSASSALLIRA